MKELEFPTTAGDLGRSLGAPVIGNGQAEIRSLAPLQSAGEGALSFFSNRKYGSFLTRIRDAVVLTSEALVRPDLPLTFIVVPDPQLAFATVARSFSSRSEWPGVSPQASVHPGAELEANVQIGPFAVIREGARIGAGTVIHPFAYVGADVETGRDCELFPHVTLLDRVRLGDRVKIYPGAVIGSDGFGYFEAGASTGLTEMPQLGTVVLEDDVRIGAHCTIDRATLGETRVCVGTKLDDQVHIGHNCRIGEKSILCAQVGLGGSTTLEEGVILGGQVGIGHGVTIGKGARMGGQSGSSTNVRGGETYFLTPAVPMRETVKIVRYLRKLPEIWERLKRLEERVEGER
jgi:UDP-3-O-[3-hydroxymyristoyl] glucosamine N-acyltransferase